MNRISFVPRRIMTLGSLLGVAVLLSLPAGAAAQRGAGNIVLAAPDVRVSSTPLEVAVAWRPVTGALSHTVEWATSPSGPWAPIPVPKGETQVTMPSSGGQYWNGMGGTLYYYRVTALPEIGTPGVTIMPRVTPQLDGPMGLDLSQEGADVRVSWAPVPYATGYVVTASTGKQVPPNQSVEVSAQQSEARLLNLAMVGWSTTVWISVNARYGTAGATSTPQPTAFTLPPVPFCWPPSAVPGPTPTVSAAATGPTTVMLSTPVTSNSKIRVERAAVGSQLWQDVRCAVAPPSGTAGIAQIEDRGLAPGTQYQYRVTELRPSGTAGQAVVLVTTAPGPDSPTVKATIGACATSGCQVSLIWFHVAGAIEYRIESTYGLYRAVLYPGVGGGIGAVPGQQTWVTLATVPAGVHTFLVTPLFPLYRPSPKPPAQVTVTVP
ncbi:MAG: hypothetical protein ACKVZ0_21945 [Gemmatimonadales bacterium]